MRMRRTVAAVVAALAAVVVAAGSCEDPGERAATEAASAPRFEFPRWNVDFFDPPVDLCLVLQDPGDEPVPFLPVTLLGQARTSDDDGRACFEDIPHGDHELGVPEGWHAHRVFSGTESASWVTVYEVCPGEVLVSFEDGTPVGGATLFVAAGSSHRADARTLDDHGTVFVADRPCGRVSFDVWDDDVRFPTQVVEVFGRERVDLVLPDYGGGILEVVNSVGEAVADARVDGASAAELEPGVFAVTAPGKVASIRVSAEAFQDQDVTLPLDDAVHRVTLEAWRVVMVTVIGGAPERMGCSERMWYRETDSCEGSGSTWRCECPTANACLRLPTVVGDTELWPVEACVPDGASVFILDRDEALGRVIGHWTGPQPCQAGQSFGVHGTCDREGRFEVDGLQSGPVTLSLWAGSDSGGTRKLMVAPGETLDLGDIAPDDGVIFGSIYADFPIDGATLYGLPGRAELFPDGSFTVAGLPLDGDIHITLRVPGWGSFRRDVQVGEMIEWDLRWREDQVGLDPPEAVDTGG